MITLSTHALKHKKNSGMGGLFYVQDEVHPLEEIIKQPLPPCPREPCIVAHWLAVEGVQPAIPQNPSKEEAEKILGVASESQDKEKRKRKRLGEVEDVEVKVFIFFFFCFFFD